VQAAGLDTQGCRSPVVIAKQQEPARAERQARQERQRRLIVAAVHECALALGELPTVTQFFRWRHRCAPHLPCKMTVYRLFPGGWNAVLKALEPPPQPLYVAAPAREELAAQPDVQAGAADQLGHEGVAGDELAARQRQ
jgi:hypothetical protein